MEILKTKCSSCGQEESFTTAQLKKLYKESSYFKCQNCWNSISLPDLPENQWEFFGWFITIPVLTAISLGLFYVAWKIIVAIAKVIVNADAGL